MARSIQHFKGTMSIGTSYTEQNLYTVPTGKVVRVTGSAMAVPSTSSGDTHITTVCGAPVQTAISTSDGDTANSSIIDLYLNEGDVVTVGGKADSQNNRTVYYGISVIEEDI